MNRFTEEINIHSDIAIDAIIKYANYIHGGEVWARSKRDYAGLQARCDRYEKALIAIRDFYPESNIQPDVVAQEALSGEGDRICPNCNKVFNADRHGCCRECGSDEYQNQKEDKQ
jgi:hypothetical protein